MVACIILFLYNITGKKSHSNQGKTIYSFKGIPYAQPPIGKLRFERPKPAKPWKNTLDLTGTLIPIYLNQAHEERFI